MKGSFAQENGCKQASRRLTAIPTTTENTANTAPDPDISSLADMISLALAFALLNEDSHLTGPTVAPPELPDYTVTNVTRAVLSMGGIGESSSFNACTPCFPGGG